MRFNLFIYQHVTDLYWGTFLAQGNQQQWLAKEVHVGIVIVFRGTHSETGSSRGKLRHLKRTGEWTTHLHSTYMNMQEETLVRETEDMTRTLRSPYMIKKVIEGGMRLNADRGTGPHRQLDDIGDLQR